MFKRLLPVLLALCAPLLIASPAMAEFGLERFAIGVQNGEGQNGTPDVQAGSHPYALTTTFVTKHRRSSPKAISRMCGLELPPGFVGDPNATPRCTYQEFIQTPGGHGGGDLLERNGDRYRDDLTSRNEESTPVVATTDPVYNLVPPPGVAAEFGYHRCRLSACVVADGCADGRRLRPHDNRIRYQPE